MFIFHLIYSCPCGCRVEEITDKIIAYEAIQKLNPNVQVIMVPAGQSLILPQEFFKK